MPKAKSSGRTKAADLDPRERKMRQMSRALGVDISQVARMLEEQEGGGSGGNVGAAAAASPAAAGLLAELTGKATASDAEDDAAAAEEDSAVPAGTSPGTVLFCGGTDWDKLGKSKATGEGNLPSPHTMSFPTRIVAVYSGPVACHSIAVDAKGTAYVWGRNDSGQCGVGNKKVVLKPTKMKLDGAVVSASCGRAHTAVVTASGALYTMGCGSSGQLGLGRNIPEKTPVMTPSRVNLPNNAEAASVACGGDFTVVLTRDGQLFNCGHPEHGQLGNDTNGEFFVSGNKIAYDFVTSFRPVEQFVSKDSKHKLQETFSDVRFSAVACGKNHTVALEAAPGRRLFSWGFAGYGRLGHASQDDELLPRVISTFERITHMTIQTITCGGACSMALAETGHLFYWGKLPNAPRGEATMYPKIVEDLGNWKVRCAAAGNQCIMVGAESSAVGWGQAIAGELGYGEGTDIPKTSRVPKKVDSLEGLMITGVAMGLAHTLLIARDSEKDDKKVLDALPAYPLKK